MAAPERGSGAGDRSGRRSGPRRAASGQPARPDSRGGRGGAHGGGRPGRGSRPERGDATTSPRPTSRRDDGQRPPELPAGVDIEALDPDVRRQLRGLPKGLAEEVGGRLAAAATLLETDPELAHRHAAEAARVASRIAPAREALGVTAYATGRWAQARSELRAARRLSGSDEYLPMLADCERGLGKPERALEIAGTPESARLDRPLQVEMRIVASGARRDLGQNDAAVVTLQCPELRDAKAPWAPRLRYAYADALLAAGRGTDAQEWFQRAADCDPEGVTDAIERLDELAGTVFTDLEDGEDLAASDHADRPGGDAPAGDTAAGDGIVDADGADGQGERAPRQG